MLQLFSPRTVFRWHNELVKRKWTYNHQNKGGRPRLGKDVQDLIVRLAKEHTQWGYGKIEGDLIKLGIKVSQTTIPSPPPEPSGLIHRRKILGGIINDYFRIPEDNVVSLN